MNSNKRVRVKKASTSSATKRVKTGKTRVKKPAKKKKQSAKEKPKNWLTGYIQGTEADIIAQELLRGASTKSEIVARCLARLPGEQDSKQVSAKVSRIAKEMISTDFVLEQYYQVQPSKWHIVKDKIVKQYPHIGEKLPF